MPRENDYYSDFKILLWEVPSRFPNRRSDRYEVEFKTGDFLFLEKHCDNFTICLFVKFWCFFFHFQSERRFGIRLKTSKGRLKVGVIIPLPRLSEFDIYTSFRVRKSIRSQRRGVV